MIETPDVEARHQIEEQLRIDPRTRDAIIDVAVLGGQASLTGDVKDVATKNAAEEVARSVPGVHVVNNELYIR
jgi:osmotically-inducible protein OsmY